MIEIHEDYDLTSMTTFGLKVECGRLIEYDTPDDLPRLHSAGLLAGILPLGGGSNMLFTTPRFHGTVLHNKGAGIIFGAQDADGNVEVEADAGVQLDRLCLEASSRGLWGMENLSGIPGEIGGASVQNVGAYGAEFQDVALSVECFDTTDGTFKTLSAQDCHYGYRDSIFKHLYSPGQMIVHKVRLRLSCCGAPNLSYKALHQLFDGKKDISPMQMRQAVISLRDSKLPSPATTGSAGSFFKNPVVPADMLHNIEAAANKPVGAHVLPSGEVKLSAAWLIDNAGCKPLHCGGAALWQQQPLVLVNATGNATAADVLNLEHLVIEKVRQTFGITLHPEVIHVPSHL